MIGWLLVKHSDDTMNWLPIDRKIAVRVATEQEFGILGRSCSLRDLSKTVWDATRTRRSKEWGSWQNTVSLTDTVPPLSPHMTLDD